MVLSPLLALTAAVAIGASSGEPIAEPIAALSRGMLRAPDLALHLADRGPGSETPLSLDGGPRRRMGGPICSGDVCQPIVSVPGFEPGYAGRDRRSEMFVALLTRAHVEPVATVAWALLATGLRFDYSPPIFDGNARARGWGSFMLRLRLRVDAPGGGVVPPRPQ